jgi:hypothetical protein
MTKQASDAVAAPIDLTITVDTGPASNGLVSLLCEISGVCELTAKGLEEGFDIVALDGNLAATSTTNNCRTVFQPTEKLVLLVPALGAFNRETRAKVGLPTG